MTDQPARPVAGAANAAQPRLEPPTGAVIVRPVAATHAALSGIVAAAAALATGELIAGLVPSIPSPLAAVGTALIDYAPPGSKEVVVSLFGTNDKTALLILVTASVVVLGAVIGLVARRSYTGAAWLVVALVGVGALASLRDPTASGPLVVLAAALQAGAGLQVLAVLLAAARRAAAARAAAEVEPAETKPAESRDVTPGERSPGERSPGERSPGERASAGAPTARRRAANVARRTFLVRAGVFGALAVVGGAIGRSVLTGRATASEDAGAAQVSIPPASDPAPSPGMDASFAIPGITPVIMPNDQFYRIDTALLTPSIDVASWNLHVFGMVDHEVRLTFDELVQLPIIERYVTIACVSNEVGGNLVGNAKWTGPRLADVLEMAGVQAGATQVVPRSVDGWTAGFPTSWITDPAHPRDAMIAIRMNDALLPVEHGFPARLIVPGLYGYVSATKWLTEIELTTLEAVDAYWVPRGWAKEAPILTQSRIDVPRNGSQVAAGPVAVAGVAWAPDRGVSRVEVRVDDGAWQTATLATELAPATWVQWKWTWQAASGSHVIEVRATDGTGAVQTDQVTPPDPDGARGHHKIAVQVG